MIRFNLPLVLLLFTRIIAAQNSSPTAVNSSGGVMQNDSYSLEWSVGELAVNMAASPDYLSTTDTLQSETALVPTKAIFAKSRFIAFPNPVANTLTLQTDFSSISTIVVNDVLGIVVLQMAFQPSIDLLRLKSGTYIISLFDQQNAFLHSFQINKI